MTTIAGRPDRDQGEVSRQRPRGQVIEQAGAVCLRRLAQGTGVEVLLIASRRTGRWGIPKGHVEAGEQSHHTARREAFEEAGILGCMMDEALGSFLYHKPGTQTPYHLTIHLLHVHEVARHYLEQDTRAATWMPLALASRNVGNLDLARILDRVAHDRPLTRMCVLDRYEAMALPLP